MVKYNYSGCGAVGSARGSGLRGRRFKSDHPDQVKPKVVVQMRKDKENYRRGSKARRWLFNSLIVLAISFAITYFYAVELNLSHYEQILAPIIDFKVHISWLDAIEFSIFRAAAIAVANVIIYQPLFIVLDFFRMKNLFKLLLGIILVAAIDIGAVIFVCL